MYQKKNVTLYMDTCQSLIRSLVTELVDCTLQLSFIFSLFLIIWYQLPIFYKQRNGNFFGQYKEMVIKSILKFMLNLSFFLISPFTKYHVSHFQFFIFINDRDKVGKDRLVAALRALY